MIISNDDAQAWYDRSNSVMAVSDQTGDGVADIITLLLDQSEPTLNVWSCVLNEDTERCEVNHAKVVDLWPEDMNTFPGTTRPTTLTHESDAHCGRRRQ